MSRAMDRMTEKAWRIGEWLTVFGAMIWALGWPTKRSRRPARFRPRRPLEAAAAPPPFAPEDLDGGDVYERARRRRHID